MRSVSALSAARSLLGVPKSRNIQKLIKQAAARILRYLDRGCLACAKRRYPLLESRVKSYLDGSAIVQCFGAWCDEHPNLYGYTIGQGKICLCKPAFHGVPSRKDRNDPSLQYVILHEFIHLAGVDGETECRRLTALCFPGQLTPIND